MPGMTKKKKPMTTQEAIKILKSHNRWRKGEDVPATCPVMLGEAIDQAVKDLEKKVPIA